MVSIFLVVVVVVKSSPKTGTHRYMYTYHKQQQQSLTSKFTITDKNMKLNIYSNIYYLYYSDSRSNRANSKHFAISNMARDKHIVHLLMPKKETNENTSCLRTKNHSRTGNIDKSLSKLRFVADFSMPTSPLKNKRRAGNFSCGELSVDKCKQHGTAFYACTHRSANV